MVARMADHDRDVRFMFILTAGERRKLAAIAERLDRSSGAVVRHWIKRTYAELFADEEPRASRHT